ncbi:hypothetical protein ACFL6U_29675 [Planctomycetota bacterium]
MTRALLIILMVCNGLALCAEVPNWPKFRGMNGAGIAAGDANAPLHFGPEQNVLWQVALPLGISSPCIWGDRLFLTGYNKTAKELHIIHSHCYTSLRIWRIR